MMKMKTIDEIYNETRDDYDRICTCEVDCVQHLDIERYFMIQKIFQCLDYKLNTESHRLGCDGERQEVISELLCLIDNVMILHCEKIISDNKEEHENESEMN